MEKEIKNLTLAIEDSADILTAHTAVKQVTTAQWFLIAQYIFPTWYPRRYHVTTKVGNYLVAVVTAQTDDGRVYHNLCVKYPNKSFEVWLTDLIY